MGSEREKERGSGVADYAARWRATQRLGAVWQRGLAGSLQRSGHLALADRAVAAGLDLARRTIGKGGLFCCRSATRVSTANCPNSSSQPTL